MIIRHERYCPVSKSGSALLALACASLLVGCTHPDPQQATDAWDTPAMQLGGDHGLPTQPVTERCRKDGCDNAKLFFNPGKPMKLDNDPMTSDW